MHKAEDETIGEVSRLTREGKRRWRVVRVVMLFPFASNALRIEASDPGAPHQSGELVDSPLRTVGMILFAGTR